MFGPGQSLVQPFTLSQFTTPGTLQSATYIDYTDLKWSIFTDVLERSCGWRSGTHYISCNFEFDGRQVEVTVSDEPTWIGALASMAPGPIVFYIEADAGRC